MAPAEESQEFRAMTASTVLLTIFLGQTALTQPAVTQSLAACRQRGELLLRLAVRFDDGLANQYRFSCTIADGSEAPDMQRDFE
jgi:hypothetical protein